MNLFYFRKLVKSIENPKIIIFIVSLIGAIAGVLFTKIVNPPEGFLNWIALLFAIIGVIIANLILLMIYEISKSLIQDSC